MDPREMSKVRDVLAFNLKYYRKQLNLPQDKFAVVIGTSLSYLNQIENRKVDVRASTIDKFALGINKYNPKLNINSLDLLNYDKSKETNYSRIDERKQSD